MGGTRIFFATDLHGSDVCFKKFLNAGKVYKANVIIAGGDITGKMMIPIVQRSDGSYRAFYLGSEKIMRSEAELEVFEKMIRSGGIYPYHTDANEMEELKADPAKVEQLFSKLMLERVREWIRLADERLRGTGIKCFIQPGNDDIYAIDQVFAESATVINPEGTIQQIDERHEMISTGHTNLTPWQCPRDISEQELQERIEKMAKQVGDMGNCVFNMHCPPYDTPLDLAPEIDENFTPKVEGGAPKLIPVGSKAVRESIERYQPLLGLHGHIHESKASVKIGRTLCLNPGSEYGEGILRGVIVDLPEKGAPKHIFLSG